MAILRTAAGLEAHNPLDLDVRTTPARPHGVRERKRLGNALGRQSKHLERLLLAQAEPVSEDLCPCCIQYVVRHPSASNRDGDVCPRSLRTRIKASAPLRPMVCVI